jgi:hypothetical protein
LQEGELTIEEEARTNLHETTMAYARDALEGQQPRPSGHPVLTFF